MKMLRPNGSISKGIGCGLAVTHLSIFFLFVWYLNFEIDDGQSQLLWVIFLVLDFPISLLVWYGYDLNFPGVGFLNSLKEALPYFVHGVLGTVWWYMFPQLISKLFSSVVRKSKTD